MNFYTQNVISISHDRWKYLKKSNFLRFLTIKGVVSREF